ncbi:MAG TPA: glycosyltransferase [Acidimicrobiales bacterium]|nr:glycosyltransferase [Acidimicrobiales bacterium]
MSLIADGSPEISIIIPTRDEAENLPCLLRSIANQREVKVEVVVVDQASDDGTRAIATEFGCKVLMVPPSGYYSPPSTSRNAGAEAAQGSILLHLDADMELAHPEVLWVLREAFRQGYRAAILREIDVALGFWAHVKAVERRCYWGTAMESARACDSLLFQALGGYDTTISSGEDFDISFRLSRCTEIHRDDRLLVLHHSRHASLVKLLDKKFNYGRTANTYLTKPAGSPDNRAIAISLSCLKAYVKARIEFRSNPLQYLAIFPLRLLELLAVLCGIAYSHITEGRGHR